MKRWTVLTVAGVIAVAFLFGCATVKGIGQDISNAGRSIEKASE